MSARINVPVLVGTVPLFTATSVTLNEGYRVQRIAGSSLAQLVSPTTKTIGIEGVLIGPGRLLAKKGLEAMALTSRALASSSAPDMKLAGIPVVSGLTISLDMQITNLRFNVSSQKRDAIDVTVSLEQVPRPSISALLGEALDVALAEGTVAIPSSSGSAPLTRQLGLPI